MSPKIPNPKLTLPKPRVPKLGRSKAEAKAGSPEATAAVPTSPVATPEADVAPKAKTPRKRFSAPKLSAPKLGSPKKSGAKKSEAKQSEAKKTEPKQSGAKKSGPKLSGPKLSLPKLAAPKMGARKGGGSPAWLSRGRPERDVVGLDIEPGYVVAAQASFNGSVHVTQAAGAPLDLDVVRDGEVLDPVALGNALAELFRGSGLGRTVRVGLANQRTVLRTLDLPPIEDAKELAAAVRFQAEEEVPMPLNNAVLDFQALGMVDTPQGQRQRVVLVAAQRDMVERLLRP